MDGKQFDSLTRAFGAGRSRRSIVKTLSATALGAVGLSRFGAAEASSNNNSACAQFCAAVFGADTTAAGQCTRQAAHGFGPCLACGGNQANFCNGSCVDLTTVTNCGSCGNACPAVNGTASCVDETCGITCDSGYVPDGSGGCEPATQGVCSGLASPNPCFPFDASHCGVNGTCRCGTDLDGKLTCYENAYCNHAGQQQCASNADCVAMGFASGSVCFAADNCCGENTTGCTTPCQSPLS